MAAYTFAPTALDADGICASQTPAAAGDLTIDGALASGGVATLGEQARITIYSGSNVSSRTFTVYGLDKSARQISEAITGPNATTVTSTLNFWRVTRVTISGSAAGAVTVGNSNALETPWVKLNGSQPVKAISVELSSGASLTYEVQWGNRDIADIANNSTNESAIVAFADTTLTAKTANAFLVTTTSAPAIRVKITSFVSGTGVLRVSEAGYYGV